MLRQAECGWAVAAAQAAGVGSTDARTAVIILLGLAGNQGSTPGFKQ